MHDQPTCGPALSPAELEAQRESDVLLHLFDAYPALFSLDELLSELTPPGTSASNQRDGFETAISDLTARGLLHQHDSYLWPTRAAKAALVLTAPGLSRVA